MKNPKASITDKKMNSSADNIGEIIMTEEVNFLKTSLSFTDYIPAKNNRYEIKLANELKKEAQKLVAFAETEFINGKTAQSVALGEQEEDSSRDLAEIAAWHFERSADAYRRAIARFEEAARLQTGKQKDFSSRARKLKKSSAQIAVDMDSLNQFLN